MRAIGQRGASCYSSSRGLFSERPHLALRETYWDEERQVTTERRFVVDAASGQVARCATSIQGYSDEAFVPAG